MFVSDAVKEIEAARRAGMQAVLCEREGDAKAAGSRAQVVHDFSLICPG